MALAERAVQLKMRGAFLQMVRANRNTFPKVIEHVSAILQHQAQMASVAECLSARLPSRLFRQHREDAGKSATHATVAVVSKEGEANSNSKFDSSPLLRVFVGVNSIHLEAVSPQLAQLLGKGKQQVSYSKLERVLEKVTQVVGA